MKKVFLFLFVLATFSLNAQWEQYVGANYTQNPGVTLTNESYQTAIGVGVASCYGCYCPASKPGDAIIRSTGGGDLIFHNNSTGAGRKIRFGQYGEVEISDLGIMKIGNINTPGNYKLYVESGILTERLKVAVKNSSDWADYVFSPNYKLKPLLEVEIFLKKYKHLPNVPSADEVVISGIDMAKMDAKLLEKIEELTLYLIEIKKENVEMKKEIKELKSKHK